MGFNATFNNIAAISWWSVLLVEETGVSKNNTFTMSSRYSETCLNWIL